MSKKSAADMKVDLPHAVQVGDRVRLREAKRAEYAEACKLAGWDFEAGAIYVVRRKDEFCPGGGERLFIDVPPHALGSRDVDLAWSDENDRREMLRGKGWRV